MVRLIAVDFVSSGGIARRAGRVATFCLSFAILSGCGKGGPPPIPRENVSGTVNYDGKPIPYGFIEFRNEETKVYAPLVIKDGLFKSGSGDGPVLGKNTAYVTGHVGEGGMPLWTGAFKTEVDIKKGDNPGVEVSIDKKAVRPYDPKNWSDNIHDRS